MRVCLNGEPMELPEGSSVAGLLQQLGLAGQRLAVELNGAIIRKSAHADTRLQPEDRLEIVHAIGGG